ncbi:MAG: hypothetical protein KF723_00525 [Rhizobiaceae bacterium]|nr:hypothetical protein [Rhizobiaceae bacterium]
MRWLPIAVAAVLAAQPASAATLHCEFTEPWIAIDFDTATGLVTLTSPDETDPASKPMPKVIGENARLVREDAWRDYQTFYLKAGEETIITLQLTGLGDDGMSDFIFPFVGSYGQLAGGCETDSAPAYDLARVYEDFGIRTGH